MNVWVPVMCPLLGTRPATQACALTENQTSNPLVRRPALNPLSRLVLGPVLNPLATPIRAMLHSFIFLNNISLLYHILFIHALAD